MVARQPVMREFQNGCSVIVLVSVNEFFKQDAKINYLIILKIIFVYMKLLDR